MEQKKVAKERKRLEALLDQAHISAHDREALLPVLDNLAWQKAKLDEARKELFDAGMTDSYNNGGGQSGTRENPAYKSYLNLWRGYLAGLDKVLAVLPKEVQEEGHADEGTDVLARVLQMKRASV